MGIALVRLALGQIRYKARRSVVGRWEQVGVFDSREAAEAALAFGELRSLASIWRAIGPPEAVAPGD
jgi:hypothetical protein